MSTVALTRCDLCLKAVEHPVAWLHLTWDDTSLDGPTTYDLCSLLCVAAWAASREPAVAR